MSIAAAIGVGSAVAGIVSGSRSADRANDLYGDQVDLMAAQLEFAREQYNDWKRVFGPIEDNLSEFYQNLTPDYFAAQGLEAYQKEFQQTQQELQDFFTANEIDTGVQLDVFSKGEFQATRDKAKIRADAPFTVANAKQDFLRLGLPQKDVATSGVLQAGTNYANTIGNQANIAAQSADAGFLAAAQGLGTAAEIFDRERLTANAGETT